MLQWTLFAAPVVFLLGAGWAHRWTTDDGFIYLRVVRMLTTGHGPVFNAGERVEAFTGPLWVAILAVGDVLSPVRLEWLALGLGLVLSAAGVAFAIAGSSVLVRRDAPTALLIPFGVGIFVALIPVWAFATSGLETGLVFAWLGASLLGLARWAVRGGRLSLRWAFLLGLGWLVRPELVVFSVLFATLVLAAQWRDDSWSRRARLIGTMFALPLAYQLFRMGYYGSVVANTAIAKEATETRWDRGWTYFTNFVDPYWLWFPVAILFVGGYAPLVIALRAARARRAQALVATFVLGAFLSALYVVAIGGDYVHARLVLPALFALCAPVAVIAGTRRYVAAALVVPWVVVAALALRPPPWHLGRSVAGNFFPPRFGDVTTDDAGWGDHGPNRAWYRGPAYYVQNTGFGVARYRRVDVPLADGVHEPVVAMFAIGVGSYALGPGTDVVDVLGLADTFTAHLERAPAGGVVPRLPGHEKPLPPPWLAARLTPAGTDVEPGDFPTLSAPLIADTRGQAFLDQVRWARRAMRCRPIANLERASSAPLTVRRFFTNMAQSLANTRLRVPPDPQRAYQRLCKTEARAAPGAYSIGWRGDPGPSLGVAVLSDADAPPRADAGARVEPSHDVVTCFAASRRPWAPRSPARSPPICRRNAHLYS